MKTVFQRLQIPADASFVVKTYYQPSFLAPIHFHAAYEIIYIGHGYGKLYSGSGVTNFTAGDVYLFGPGFEHCFYNDPAFLQSGEMAHAIVIQFTRDFAGESFFETPELRQVRSLLDNSSYGCRLLTADSTKKLFFQFEHKPLPDFILLLRLLYELSGLKSTSIFRLASDLTSINNLKDYERMEPVLKYILENFTNEVKSAVAATIAHLNLAAFCRYFKRRTGKTFSQFVNDVRITHACKMLQDGKESIAHICFECGYGNVSYFNRQFKLAKGMTPLAYRNAFKSTA